VRVTHDVPLWGLASGRIKALLDDGVNISAITLDEACPMETGKQYGIRVRQADGQSVYRNVITNAGETTTLTLVNPLALAAGPLPGDLVQFGEQSAAPGPDLSARITAVDHAPGIFTAATQAIPDFDPGITVPPGALTPVIDSIRSNEAVLVRDADGSLRPRIFVAFALAANRPYHELDAIAGHYRHATPDAQWRALPLLTAYATETSINDVHTGETYELRFRYRYRPVRAGAQARVGPWTLATHKVIGTSTLPRDVARFWLQGTRLWWLYPQRPPDFAGFRLREHTGLSRIWATATPVHDDLIKATTFDIGQSERTTKTYLLKPVDSAGNEAATAAALIVNVASAAAADAAADARRATLAAAAATVGMEFGDAPIDNIVLSRDYAAENYTGTVTGASQVGAELHAADLAGLFWGAAKAKFWDAAAAGLYWGAIYAPLVYETEFTPALYAGDVPLRQPVWRLRATFSGEDPRLSYSPGDTSYYWGELAANPFWGADADLIWPADALDWVPWPGELPNPDRQSYPLRVDIEGGTVQGKVSNFAAELDVADIAEAFEDLPIAALGTRLPVTYTYARIKTVSLTLQDDGGLAAQLKIVDKERTGPLIKAFDAAGVATTAVVDARVQDY